MADNASFGVTDTKGVSMPEGTEIQSVDYEQSAEISELQAGESGEVIKASTTHVKKVSADFSLIGSAGSDSVEVGEVSSPEDLEIISAEPGEEVNKRPTLTLKAAGFVGIDDGDGGGSGSGGSGADEDTLEVVSVEYSLAQSVKRGFSVSDEMMPGKDGKPALRQKFKKVNTFSFDFAGDVPGGVDIGSGGASVNGLEGGKLITDNLKEKQMVGKWNSGSASGKHYASAV